MGDILNSVKSVADGLLSKGQGIMDGLFPPENRSEWAAKLEGFVVANPKTSAFLLTNFALSGIPLFLFAVMTVTVFVFSLIAAFLIGLIVALVFTVFAVGTALLILFPTIFFTTLVASFLLLWGLCGYYIIKWFNEEPKGPAPKGAAIGEKLNHITGGRMGWIMDSARSNEEAQELAKAGGPTEVHGDENASKGGPSEAFASAPSQADGHVQGTVNQATKATGVDGVKSKAGNVTNTAGATKGAVGGATGVT